MTPTPHSPNIIDCGSPGKSYEASLDFTTDCWPEAKSRLVLRGKLAEHGERSHFAVDVMDGPPRAFSATLLNDGCVLTIAERESGVACDFSMNPSEDVIGCKSRAGASHCTFNVHLPPGTTR